MMKLVLLPALLLAVLAGTAPASTSAPFCTGQQLSGAFSVLRGSAGAGTVVYTLRLRNRSRDACTVTGIPALQLLGRQGGALPTQVRAATATALRPVLVTVLPGRSTTASARFSPDVPGTGEPLTSGSCEPTAYHVRVAALGGGTTTVPISPPTPVCEHGSLQTSGYAG